MSCGPDYCLRDVIYVSESHQVVLLFSVLLCSNKLWEFSSAVGLFIWRLATLYGSF